MEEIIDSLDGKIRTNSIFLFMIAQQIKFLKLVHLFLCEKKYLKFKKIDVTAISKQNDSVCFLYYCSLSKDTLG